MLRYRIEGTGTPLLLIHGWGVTYTIWQNLAPLLRPHFQLIMIELPGVGGSPPPDPRLSYYDYCAEALEEVRRELGLPHWYLLSYSSGTRAAEAYIQHYPNSIVRAVFLCPIYLQEIWAVFLRLMGKPRSTTLTQWIFSDWRLYNLIRALGFNWERHAYTYTWKNEIELQSITNLMRVLTDMPGKGRAPFIIPTVPTLFVWGRRDALTARPRHPIPNHITISANHSAPMLAPESVAETVIPFLLEGIQVAPEVETAYTRSLWHLWRLQRNQEKRRTHVRTGIRGRQRRSLKGRRARLLSLLRRSRAGTTASLRFTRRKKSKKNEDQHEHRNHIDDTAVKPMMSRLLRRHRSSDYP